jgi:hypothetical protein
MISFSPNTRIKSAEVNSNFAEVAVSAPATFTGGEIYKNDGVTVLPVGYQHYLWTQIGKLVTVWAFWDFVGDPGGTTIGILLPTAAESIAKNKIVGTGHAISNSTNYICVVRINASVTTKAIIFLSSVAAWHTSGNMFNVQFTYNAA